MLYIFESSVTNSTRGDTSRHAQWGKSWHPFPAAAAGLGSFKESIMWSMWYSDLSRAIYPTSPLAIIGLSKLVLCTMLGLSKWINDVCNWISKTNHHITVNDKEKSKNKLQGRYCYSCVFYVWIAIWQRSHFVDRDKRFNLDLGHFPEKLW